jgi:hypothetical protein
VLPDWVIMYLGMVLLHLAKNRILVENSLSGKGKWKTDLSLSKILLIFCILGSIIFIDESTMHNKHIPDKQMANTKYVDGERTRPCKGIHYLGIVLQPKVS